MAAAIDFAASVDLVDPLCKLPTINDAQGQMAIEEDFKSTQDKWMKWVVQMRILHGPSEKMCQQASNPSRLWCLMVWCLN